MPSWINPATACSPNMSRPTRAIRVTLPPARAAPTAWFAPLPPAAVRNSPPSKVSPGRGRRANLMIMSVLELPTTRMRLLVMGFLSPLRGNQNAEPQQVEEKHRAQQLVGSRRRVLEFLPNENAPERANQCRALAKPIRQRGIGGGGGDDAEAHADVPNHAADDADRVEA